LIRGSFSVATSLLYRQKKTRLKVFSGFFRGVFLGAYFRHVPAGQAPYFSYYNKKQLTSFKSVNSIDNAV